MTLTKHHPGSIKELWSLANPLMLQTISILFMIFVDRVFLSFYSQESFNASVNSSTTSWAILVFFLSLASIGGTVLVSQYHGSHQPQKFGAAVWQMVWLGLFTTALFIPLALYGPQLIWRADRALEKRYFFWAIVFGPAYALYGAFSAFFIGQGNTRIVSYLALWTNLVNIFLDWVLIFGIPGVIPSFGISGAAIATSVSMIIQMCFLACAFFERKNIEHKGAGQWKFQPKILKQCLKVGAPGATAASLEVGAWAMFYELMTEKGSDYITVNGIFQSFNLLFFFFEDGLMRGISIVSGYLIGSRQRHRIPTVLKNGAILQTYYAIFVVIFLFLLGKPIAELFLSSYPPEAQHLLQTILYGFPIIAVYLYLDGLRFNLIGVLTGAGDTFFLLLSGVFSIWVLLLGPVYIALYMFNVSILGSFSMVVVYMSLALAIVYLRYRWGNWVKLDLSREPVETPPLHYN